VFQDSAPSQPAPERPFRLPGAKSAAPAAAPATKAEEKKKDSEPLGNFGLDPRAVALPGLWGTGLFGLQDLNQLLTAVILLHLRAGSIAAIAGLGLVASKVDGGFNEWINESGALVRVGIGRSGRSAVVKASQGYGRAQTCSNSGRMA
jgi:hypothetical protein